MAVNKVNYYGKVLIDISDSTVTAETLLEGIIAYDASGNRIVGTMKPSVSVSVTDDGEGNVIISGVTATDDGSGNVTISGVTVSDDNGNITIGG